MPTPRLTETSFVVLGLLEVVDEATPYDLKQVAEISVFNFWSVPHTQIYTECERLAESGLLQERRETEGRRRRFYRLTARGREALDQWRSEPTEQLYDARDLGTLKLFFGSDPKPLATAQLAGHQGKLEELQEVAKRPELEPGMRLAAELGINQERAFIRFWTRLLDS